MKITNKSGKTVELSVNKWGDSGNTSYFTVKNDKSESWGRSDVRGFVLSLSQGGSTYPFLIMAYNDYKVTHSGGKFVVSVA